MLGRQRQASEGSAPLGPDAVNRLIKRIGERAGFDYPVHAHMLRHGCGYPLANAAMIPIQHTEMVKIPRSNGELRMEPPLRLGVTFVGKKPADKKRG